MFERGSGEGFCSATVALEMQGISVSNDSALVYNIKLMERGSYIRGELEVYNMCLTIYPRVEWDCTDRRFRVILFGGGGEVVLYNK